MASPGVLIDWDGDGFRDEAGDPIGAYDDVTADVASWRVSRGGSAEATGGSEPGTCTIVLNNPADDRYNPFGSGPLAGKLHDGVAVWIGIGDDGTFSGDAANGLFAGRIVDVTPVLVSGATQATQVEITCEDPLAWFARTPVHVPAHEGRTYSELRFDMLHAAGVEGYADLEHEIATVPVSAWDGMLLAGLEAVNAANGTRHFIHPADDPDAWYSYVTRPRSWMTGRASADASLDDGASGISAFRGITGSSGWRVSGDGLVNSQTVSVEPVTIGPASELLWSTRDPLALDDVTHVFEVEFADVVLDADITVTWTGAEVFPTITAGRVGRISILAPGASVVTSMEVRGRMVRRGEPVRVTVEASTAGARGVRAGADISGEFVGTLANARGLASFIANWHSVPRVRPTVVVEDWMPQQFVRDLHDVLRVDISALGSYVFLAEIVGLAHESVAGGVVRTTYTLREWGWDTWWRPAKFVLDDPAVVLDETPPSQPYWLDH